jgi:CBS domain-containing protein
LRISPSALAPGRLQVGHDLVHHGLAFAVAAVHPDPAEAAGGELVDMHDDDMIPAVPAQASVTEAARQMHQQGVKRLPVVNEAELIKAIRQVEGVIDIWDKISYRSKSA